MDIRYSIDISNNKGVKLNQDFSGALTNEERSRFYRFINNNQRGNIIDDCAVRIIVNENTDNTKLVCYKRISDSIKIVDVFLLENYDYSITEDYDDAAVIIAEGVKNGYSERTLWNVLHNSRINVQNEIFRRYNQQYSTFDQIGQFDDEDLQDSSEEIAGGGVFERNREIETDEYSIDTPNPMEIARMTESDADNTAASEKDLRNPNKSQTKKRKITSAFIVYFSFFETTGKFHSKCFARQRITTTTINPTIIPISAET